MEDYDFNDDIFEEEDEPVKERAKIDTLDIFSILLLVGAVCLGGYFMMVFINPYSGINPLPPATPIPPIVIPSATITPQQLGELWTATPTIQPTVTNTPRPTFTPIPTNTPIVLFEPTATPETPTATATPGLPFEAEIQYIQSTIMHPDLGCNWLGVGGTVEDMDKSPLVGVAIRIQGELLGQKVDTATLSGIATAYGRSGFELILGEAPIPSTETLYVRLYDQAGLPLSEKIYFNTSAECTENLVLMRFKKVR
jgi:hypothetical protein